MCNKCGCATPWRGLGPDPRKINVSSDEAAIIARAAENALVFDTGILTACEDAGYEWHEYHEKYVFQNFIEPNERKPTSCAPRG